ncbi:MAG: site-specific integrase, partial [Nitrosopumilaceae archaeon]
MHRSLLIFQNSIKSAVTLNQYMYYLGKFVEFCKLNDFESLISVERGKLQMMVEDYVMDLKKRVNPNSIPTYLYGIQSFFESNDIELNWK